MSEYKFINFTVDNGVGHLELNRPEKKNAINDSLCLEIEHAFINLPDDVSVIVFSGSGPEFCSGLDLAEHKAREPFEVVKHSNMWHRVFGHITNSGIPVVAAMHGAVIGGGLELAITAHVRVTDETTFYRLPEGKHGIFVGGGASVNVAKVIGTSRMTEMMLTGRNVDAQEGYRIGLGHYVVEKGQALQKAFEIAQGIAKNSKYSNWAMTTGLRNIESMAADQGLYTESLLCGITQTSEEVKARIDAFLNRKKS
ncbi:crotonase/enoyl-CoA hydratase family protein [Marinomonas mediterranea]|uniref:Enoyl-CoA hydratase/isomerase n=1 Tax=Marinomonas mediterranea (strain ATCC 700492 / JCM 21426 / NBRC 103028 / MMB-1) TaxID=717774 RepID=F2JWS1_MARM1|nr:crotonase/enoyl-CoA hydratase family protein [Marinomonas mediterranea]ADZ91835.1 Enoyl-CoA hydratase/isomerase [Marinomonas mediterranea MMB-1]WCN09788.1 crotonase/enoyl-CoA hydratase family protein [Marinomonas mediterranea]WCN13871.1 crotonase/enoyl-CoA hydratase family protein [Marinomonas mediterranea]WCN17927.1 crotonase/enoyl-CoA hydratase family protein [Marinomonas mediterranea MMB-1]